MNYLVATKEDFKTIGIEITTERQLEDGRYIKHLELSDPMWTEAWGKVGFELMRDEDIPNGGD